jgi:RsiW-degrading membrane proteinase PrsW (M82 family)
MTEVNHPLARWQKQLIAIAGLLLMLPGFPIIFGFLCVTSLVILGEGKDAVWIGLLTFALALLTAGAGGVTFWQAMAALQHKKSAPARLPHIWSLTGIFALLVIGGLVVTESNFGAGLLFPPILVVAAALPPLLAVSWFMAGQVEDLTWRRALVAFAGGATIGVITAILLEILLPLIVLALVLNLADIVMDKTQTLFEALAGKDVATAMTSPGFIYVFVQVAVIAPLAEELAKPLVTLPLAKHLSSRTTFLVGAMAGAGFATVENVLYAGLGFYFWAGILLVRAIGGAIHPLGAGLVALGWRDVLLGNSQAWLKWLARFGLAVGMHALWNGGSLLVITLAGTRFFGELPPEISILGLSAAGTTLALLIILGLGAMWLGRSIARYSRSSKMSWQDLSGVEFVPSDRAVALWALACLLVIVPVGLTGFQLWLR